MAEKNRFQALALHLAEGLDLRTAARRAGVAERTAGRVVRDPRFRRLLKRARGRLWRSLAGQLTAACRDAIATLQAVATDERKPATARVSAAGRLLDLALRYRESFDTERRLTALEAR
jgi:hypothetical protein